MSLWSNWDQRRVTRREALELGAITAGALALGSTRAFGAEPDPFGELVPRPDLIDLPRGFQYRVISTRGEPMSDGRPTPGDPDGMVAVRGPRNTTVLIRNHELGFQDDHIQGVESTPDKQYDPAGRGGTTAIWVDPTRRNVREYVTSSGTRNNCAGGGTPWGTWLTCEEDREPNHGFMFEVRWEDPEGPLTRTPIRDMGFFSHEATDINPATGIAYLTEDDFRGGDVVPGSDSRVSYLYRYPPRDRSRQPGALQEGGRLQSAAIEQLVTPAERTADFFNPGQTFGIVWKDVDPTDPPASAEAQGCIRFNRLEGAIFGGGVFWFDDTVGGGSEHGRLGQVFRLIPGADENAPGADRLELFFEATSTTEFENIDNVTITPWGDAWFAEDGPGENRIIGITPDGRTYTFARTVGSEFAGPTFSPDGRTFFLNAQDHGLTYAIWGPFPRRNRDRRRQMAQARLTGRNAVRISGELAEAARRHGLTELEAAAYDRLGVPLV